MLLIVVQQEELIGRSEEGETARSFSPSLSTLAGVRQVHLATPQEHRRLQSDLPTVHTSALQRQWKKDIRVAQGIVIEKVSALGMEVIGVKRPTSERNSDSELVLLIAFAVQRQEPEAPINRKS